MKKTLVVIALSIIVFFAQAQQKYSVKPSRIVDESILQNCPATIIDWENITKRVDEKYHLNFTPKYKYSSFGVGFATETKDVNCIDLLVRYRLTKRGESQTKWRTTDFETNPSESDTKLFWSELIFTPDGTAFDDVEIEIICPSNVDASKIRVSLMDINKSKAKFKPKAIKKTRTTSCPAMPQIIPRSTWLDPYYTQPAYTSTVINSTHTVIHHGASPDTYTNGASIVRSYWNYHVNTKHWSDIGYNYLLDKYGNIYQGRQNSNMELQDVRGAHAGASNSYSIGINFLGNADVTTPTTVQLETLYQMLGWWYTDRGFDPTSSANIVLQSGGTASKYRICGHKDVNVGGTSCPGVTLYALLSDIRNSTQDVIDACSSSNLSTSVSADSDWQSDDFTVTFTDSSDAGVETGFYQVLDYNNSEWRANSDFGFFNDDFDNTINSDWTNFVGNWSINSSFLNQSNEDSSNTNIYTSVTQTSGNVYLYQFDMKISGSGTNKRAGIHFFCDDASALNRHNSYMVYFRSDGNKCQIYKYDDNSMSLETDVACTINDDTWYNYQITFNTTTGEIKAYKDGSFVSSWTDSSPYTAGNSISLRTGNCSAEFNDLKVLKNRTSSEIISVGNASSEVRYENTNPTAPACKIKSIIVDANNNWSNLENLNVNIDWTQPSQITVNDGFSVDIDTAYNNTELSANWTSSVDQNSDIASYEYCIGNTAGASDVVPWINNGAATNVTAHSLSLAYGSTYYYSVKAINNANLESNIISSDGVFLVQLGTPTTSVNLLNNWETSDFTVNFSDASDVNVNTSFYNVLDYNNSEWRANSDFGFFNDNFNSTIHSDWTNSVGTWSINSGAINQSDENEGNTNIYASVNQISGNTYLYQFKMKIGGTGTNRRAGVHFFSDNASLSNRNNSYMVYFRADGNRCQIYKNLGDVIDLKSNDTCVINADEWYNYKIIFNTISGEISAFQENQLISTWTDSSAFSTGDYISLRTGNCNVDYDDIAVYKSRTSSQNITIGSVNAEVRYQNENSGSPACKINSVIYDDAHQWSANADANVNIDWTNPDAITINDGLSADIDATDDNTQLSANWTNSADENSDFNYYEYCVGTVAGANNIVAWTNNGTNTNVSVNSLSLTFGETYFVSVKSVNNAGLETINSADGIYINQAVVSDSVIAIFHAVDTLLELPNASVVFVNTSVNADSYTWDFGDGDTSTDTNPWHTYTSSGYFTVSLIAHSTTLSDDTLTFIDYVHVSPAQTSVEANFYSNDVMIYLPTAIATFVNTSTNATSYVWDFGDGTSSSDANPSHQYATEGVYTVKLIAHSTSLDDDTLTRATYISVGPIQDTVDANFYALDTIVELGNIATFMNTSTNADSYTWNFGDGATATDNNPWHLYADTGYYSVSLIAHSNLLNDDTLVRNSYIHVVIIDNNKIVENNEFISIYPNPTKDFIQIENLDNSINSIKIFDISGKLIREIGNFNRLNKAKLKINISQFSKGVYFVKITTNNNFSVKKIIKE